MEMESSIKIIGQGSNEDEASLVAKKVESKF